MKAHSIFTVQELPDGLLLLSLAIFVLLHLQASCAHDLFSFSLKLKKGKIIS